MDTGENQWWGNLESNVCKHFEYCSIAKISGRNCADYENCQTYKYYERYGTEPLGIGAMVKVPAEMEGEYKA